MAALCKSHQRLLLAFRTTLSLLCFLSACIELSDAATSVDVYRMIQYDMQGSSFGSRRAGLSHFANSGLDLTNPDLSRAVIVMPLKGINFTLINEIIDGKRLVGGLVLIFPKNFGSSDGNGEKNDDDSELDHNLIRELEMKLIYSNLPFPVYFVMENEYINQVYEKIKSNDLNGNSATAANGGYKFVINAKEPKKLTQPSFFTIEGWLKGNSVNDDKKEISDLPTIAIVSSYDTFGAVPGLSMGRSGGVSSLLELLRLFSILNSNSKSKPNFNFLFALTSASPYNYQGTKQWLNSFDQRILENIEFALCLDDINNEKNEKNENIFFHVSKPPKDASIKRFIDGFTTVANEYGVNVEIIHKKINISDPRFDWEHEQFSLKRVKALTVSKNKNGNKLFENNGGISSSFQRFYEKDASLLTSTQIIAESIARYVYHLETKKDVHVFSPNSSLSVDENFLSHFQNFVSQNSRFFPLLQQQQKEKKEKEKNSKNIISAFQKEFSSHSNDVELKTFAFDSTFSFYDSFQSEMSIYQVASVGYDLAVLLYVLFYLGLLYLILYIATKGLDDLLGVNRRSSFKKQKVL